MTAGTTVLLDATALLAYLQGEPGSETVRDAISAGAAISAPNYAEVLWELADAGATVEAVQYDIGKRLSGLLEVVPFTQEDADMVGNLRITTRGRELSLGDHACLATALRLRLPVLTADPAWKMGLELVGVRIRHIRD